MKKYEELDDNLRFRIIKFFRDELRFREIMVDFRYSVCIGIGVKTFSYGIYREDLEKLQKFLENNGLTLLAIYTEKDLLFFQIAKKPKEEGG